MRFNRRLNEESISEWKSAYVDYKFLKIKLKRFHNSNSNDDNKLSVNKININSDLQDIIINLPSTHRSFFTTMDSQLIKVNTFFLDRLSDAQKQAITLDSQLLQLKKHRISFHSKYPKNYLLAIKGAWDIRHHLFKYLKSLFNKNMTGKSNDENFNNMYSGYKDDDIKLSDPHGYNKAQRKLKSAVFELHRYLNMLKSYVELNQTAFYKALKKYDKVANNSSPLISRYIDERVNCSDFVTSPSINYLLDGM